MIRGKRNGPEPRQPRNWLRQVGIVAASLVFLPVALFSVAVFVGLFLVILVAAKTASKKNFLTVQGDFDKIIDVVRRKVCFLTV
jgi:hypothetical protein